MREVILKTLLLTVCPLLGFWLALILRLPAEMGAQVRHGFNLWILVVGALIYLGFRFSRAWGDWLPLTCIAVLFGLSLAGLWSNASSEMQVVGGMLFFSDAQRYLADAMRLLNGFPISSFSARHPLPTLFLAVLLWLTSGNLQVSLAITVLLVAASVFLAANEVRQTGGPTAAAVFTLVVFLFYRRFSGMPDSENLGLALGCLGFALLLRGSGRPMSKTWLAGLFLLTLGLVSRPGALLVLPAVLVWLALRLKANPRRALMSVGLGMLVVGLGLLANTWVNTLVAEKTGRAFSNFAYSAYGIVQGGKGWEQFMLDYPEAARLAEVEAEKMAFDKTWQSITGSPGLALRGAAGAYADFFSLQDSSVFGYLCGGELTAFNRPVEGTARSLLTLVRLLAYAASAYGLWRMWKNRGIPENSLLLSMLLGVLGSIACVPPRDAGMMRVYAATLPCLALLPAAGIAGLAGLGRLKWRDAPDEQPRDGATQTLLVGLAVMLALVCAAAPLLFKGLQAAPHPTRSGACPAGEVGAEIQLSPGSFIVLRGDAAGLKPRFPDVGYTDYQASVSAFHRKEMVAPLASIPAGTLLVNAVDRVDGKAFWVLLPVTGDAPVGQTLAVCGTWQPQFAANGLGFLDVHSLTVVEEK